MRAPCLLMTQSGNEQLPSLESVDDSFELRANLFGNLR